MEIKKSQSIDQVPSLKKAQDFVADVKTEIHRVTWTSREELILYTQIVVLATFLFGLAIYGLDLSIQGILNGLNFLIRLIGG